MAQTNNRKPQTQRNGFAHQTNTRKHQQTHGDVWQDKDAASRVRGEALQPVMIAETPRTGRMNTHPPRSQTSSKRGRLVQIAFWTEEPIRDQILHLAASSELSISQTTNALVKDILRERYHQQQAATLPALIDHAVAKAHRSLAARLVALLVRIAFDTGQTRVLATNILGRQSGMTEHTLKDILDTADKRTKANLTRRTPQITELIEAVEQWLLTDETEAGRRE